MFQLLKHAIRVLLKNQNITDKESGRAFLLDFVSCVKASVQESGNKFDDAVLQHIEFILQNNALFDYAYCQVCDHVQTEEILFESSPENTVAEFVENTMANNEKLPESIDPVVIISLISRLANVMNTIKQR